MRNNDVIRETLSSLETPAVLIDRGVLEENIARAAEIARYAGAALRPHVKTHKSLRIAELQIKAGAAGVTTAKPSEAAVFLDGGVRDVTVAYPLVDPRKAERLIQMAAGKGARLRLVADSTDGIEAITAAASSCEATVEVMVEVDVGLLRCGVDPANELAAHLAARLGAHPSTIFAGLLSHAGQAYAAKDADHVRQIAEAERRTMTSLARKLRDAGIKVPTISVGSTPTVWLGESFEGITELRPGNAVFMDLTQVSLGVALPQNLALSVLATVISVNHRFAIIDAGSKVLSSDVGPHGSKRLTGYGVACLVDDPAWEIPVVNLSEEHGFLAHGGKVPRIGARVRIWPNHACPVVNLAEQLVAISGNGNIERWTVDARGCVW